MPRIGGKVEDASARDHAKCRETHGQHTVGGGSCNISAARTDDPGVGTTHGENVEEEEEEVRLLALARVEDGGSGEEGKETKTTKETDPRIDLPVCEEAAGPGPPDNQDDFSQA
ncbi:hypothetical protein PCL_11580 [Purpureocillium lilacinum]|uniref:Uncharacterized protein n=1 Tax=Purpureocillium lilacinum TaxID=33203 RepID=A0A2U3EAE7_PURLI|nr:hypothetical protein Purlil1_2831 [Purpureocillium lilacinum]PWI71486.1 hypothetical protein PCL_11580 [Purpureocillium lilacinum]